MEVHEPHPLTIALRAVSPIVGANHVLRSARDAEIEPDKYPLIEYIVRLERKSVYDSSAKCWRVELVVQINYLLQDDGNIKCLKENELSDAQKVQALQFDLTSKIRSIVQIITDPESLSSKENTFSACDFIFAKYDFKLVDFVESAYLRNHGSDDLTGAACLFVLSLKDVNNVCCSNRNREEILKLLKPESVSAQMLKLKIENE